MEAKQLNDLITISEARALLGVSHTKMAQMVKSVRPYLSTPARHEPEFLDVRGR